MGIVQTKLASIAAAPSRARYLPWVVVLLLSIWLFRDTGAAMVSIWWRSETYAHAFLVVPISAWLMWRRREVWIDLPVQSNAWWLIGYLLACLFWLLGELANVSAASQFAMVALIIFSVPAILGWAVTRSIQFPLLFLFFCVPIGEFLTEPMIAATADFTVAALAVTGLPVYREGMQFVIPSGTWSVVEACSGVRYLIASFMVGTLFAYLNYNSWRRRLAFIVVSLITPIVANWLRAYMIVMLGHLSGNRLAVGADHLVYGWVFFGVVVMLMFWIGSRFSEPELAQSAKDHLRCQEPTSAGRSGWAVATAAVALMVVAQGLQARLDHAAEHVEVAIELPDTLPGGWRAEDPALSAWVPAYRNPSATAGRTYRAGDDVVAVWVGFYRRQGNDRKLVTSANRLVDGESRSWAHAPQSVRSLKVGEAAEPMRGALLRTPADPGSAPMQRLDVLYFYRIGGHFTASEVRAKLRLALGRLLGRGDDGAVIFFYVAADDDGGQSRRRLERFVYEQATNIAAVIDGMTANP